MRQLKEIPKGSQDVVHTALDMYKKALGLSTASMGLANLRVNASRRDLKNDIFLWFNMIHLVILSWDSLNMTLDKLLQLFQESFEYISHDKHRSLLWIKYVFTCQQIHLTISNRLLRILTHPLIKPSQDVKDLVSTLDKAFGDMQAYFTCPTYCRDCDHEFVKPVPSVVLYLSVRLLNLADLF